VITETPKNILVADDSVFFRTKLSDILIEAGHKVMFAVNGKEVIEEIEIGHSDIDLLLLDLQMPEVDGFGVLEWMAENGHKGAFPVLAITGVYEPGRIYERLKGLGVSGLMTKGFTPEQIIFRVNRILFPDKAAAGAPNLRVPVSIAVDFSVGRLRRTGYLLNLSETGTFLHTRKEMLVGALVHLRFSLPGTARVLDVKGLVKWSTREVATRKIFGGYGIMFTTIADEDREAIRMFVETEAHKMGLYEE